MLLILLSAISAWDIWTSKIPNLLVLLVVLFGFLLVPSELVLGRLFEMCIVFLLGTAISEISERIIGRPSLGMGDVKLVAASMIWLGLTSLPALLVLSSGTALIVIWVLKRPRTQEIAFGPFLSGGIIMCYLWPDLARTWGG